MKVTFPFTKIGTNFFGEIWRPYVKLLIKEKGGDFWLERIMLVDSGADYSLFPKRDAAIFGIDINKECRPETTFGVGGSETVYLYKNLDIKLDFNDETVIKIPVGFLERNDIPALLGRQEIFKILKIIFYNHQTIFEI